MKFPQFSLILFCFSPYLSLCMEPTADIENQLSNSPSPEISGISDSSDSKNEQALLQSYSQNAVTNELIQQIRVRKLPALACFSDEQLHRLLELPDYADYARNLLGQLNHTQPKRGIHHGDDANMNQFETQLLALMQKQTQIQQDAFAKSIQDGKDADEASRRDIARNWKMQVIGWGVTAILTIPALIMSGYSLAGH